VAALYNAAGIPAEVLSAETPADAREAIIQRFRNREIWQLVNVDILGEGFDLGNGVTVEVVSMARPTQSYGLYVQQFGRPIRPKEDGSPGIIIDHVNNVPRHGLPDRERIWSLDAREKRAKVKDIDASPPLRYCTGCTQPYEKVLIVCPYCGTKYEPAARSSPEFVDGDLFELSPEVLAQMRGEVAKVDESPESMLNRMQYAGAPDIAARSAAKNQRLRAEAQSVLRDAISRWARVHHDQNRSDREIHKRFWFAFGIDILSAQSLGRSSALELTTEIEKYYG
jgi:superfamily II DNA or RNA helicase